MHGNVFSAATNVPHGVHLDMFHGVHIFLFYIGRQRTSTRTKYVYKEHIERCYVVDH